MLIVRLKGIMNRLTVLEHMNIVQVVQKVYLKKKPLRPVLEHFIWFHNCTNGHYNHVKQF